MDQTIHEAIADLRDTVERLDRQRSAELAELAELIRRLDLLTADRQAV